MQQWREEAQTSHQLCQSILAGSVGHQTLARSWQVSHGCRLSLHAHCAKKKYIDADFFVVEELLKLLNIPFVIDFFSSASNSFQFHFQLSKKNLYILQPLAIDS